MYFSPYGWTGKGVGESDSPLAENCGEQAFWSPLWLSLLQTWTIIIAKEASFVSYSAMCPFLRKLWVTEVWELAEI